MKYGALNLVPKKGSTTITKRKSQIVQHYPGTDKQRFSDLGRQATVITTTLIANSKAERIAIEQVTHLPDAYDLEYMDFKYKNVITGEISSPTLISPNGEAWEIEADFIALDPIPYDIVTGDPLY